MNANGTEAAALLKECPVCQDAFNAGVNLPKVLVCGHSVCAVCVPGCIRRIGRAGRATCPLCRQETPIPPHGLPTNYHLRDVIAIATVKCSGCGKYETPSDAFACKTCTGNQEDIMMLCGACSMRAHRAHDVIEHSALASVEDVRGVLSDERSHIEEVRRYTALLSSFCEDALENLAKTCENELNPRRQTKVMSKDEHERDESESVERRRRIDRAIVEASWTVGKCIDAIGDIKPNGPDPSSASRKREYPTRPRQQYINPFKWSLPRLRPGQTTVAVPYSDSEDDEEDEPKGPKLMYKSLKIVNNDRP